MLIKQVVSAFNFSNKRYELNFPIQKLIAYEHLPDCG